MNFPHGQGRWEFLEEVMVDNDCIRVLCRKRTNRLFVYLFVYYEEFPHVIKETKLHVRMSASRRCRKTSGVISIHVRRPHN